MAAVLDQRPVVLLRQAEERREAEEGRPAAHEDRVKRLFTATAPNTLWLMDITEHKTLALTCWFVVGDTGFEPVTSSVRRQSRATTTCWWAILGSNQ
ncbi:MAG: hypothetical protein WB797_01615 [Nocardioides sp.]